MDKILIAEDKFDAFRVKFREIQNEKHKDKLSIEKMKIVFGEYLEIVSTEESLRNFIGENNLWDYVCSDVVDEQCRLYQSTFNVGKTYAVNKADYEELQNLFKKIHEIASEAINI